MVYIIFDIALAAIFIICMIVGFVKGFIDQILDLVSGIVAFVSAYFLTPLVAPFVSRQFFLKLISQKIAEAVSGLGAGIFENGAANETFRSITERFGADYDAIKNEYMTMASTEWDKAGEAITNRIAEPVSLALSYALCFVVIVILVLFILWLIKHLLDLAAKLPVIKHANKILGLVAGALLGVLVVWVISFGLKLGLPYLNTVAPSVFPEDLFDKSLVLRFCYEINAVRTIIDTSYLNNLTKA